MREHDNKDLRMRENIKIKETAKHFVEILGENATHVASRLSETCPYLPAMQEFYSDVAVAAADTTAKKARSNVNLKSVD